MKNNGEDDDDDEGDEEQVEGVHGPHPTTGLRPPGHHCPLRPCRCNITQSQCGTLLPVPVGPGAKVWALPPCIECQLETVHECPEDGSAEMQQLAAEEHAKRN